MIEDNTLVSGYLSVMFKLLVLVLLMRLWTAEAISSGWQELGTQRPKRNGVNELP